MHFNVPYKPQVVSLLRKDACGVAGRPWQIPGKMPARRALLGELPVQRVPVILKGCRDDQRN